MGTSVVGANDVSSVVKSELAVLGGRQRVANSSRFELALRGDLAVSRLATTDGEAASAGLNANVHRVRTGIETSYALDWIGGSTLTPFGQMNLRFDGGDGDTGSGLEFTGGLRLSQSVYSIELTGRTFETRGQRSYTESGYTMTATINPSHDGTGFSASVSPQWGANVHSGNAIWNELTPGHGVHPLRNAGSAASYGGMKLDTQVGYGVLIADERFLLTPFIQHAQYGTEHRQSQIGVQLRQFLMSKGSISSRFAVGRTNRFGKQENLTYGFSVQVNF